MDLQEKIQFWRSEIERAEQYNFYFDVQSMREVVEVVEEQQKENERLTQIIKQNSLPLHPCGVCGKEERNPGLDVCGECYHKQIWGND